MRDAGWLWLLPEAHGRFFRGLCVWLENDVRVCVMCEMCVVLFRLLRVLVRALQLYAARAQCVP